MKTLFSFKTGRNINTIRLEDIKKISILEHKIKAKQDDKDIIQERFFALTVYGNTAMIAEDGSTKYETIIQIKSNESEYADLYKTYERLNKAWDEYQTFVIQHLKS